MRCIRLTVLFFMVFLSLSVCAQQSYDGLVIDRINFTGLKQVSVNELSTLTNAYLGKPYSTKLFNDLQAALYALGYFEGLIEPSFRELPSKRLAITFTVKERPIVLSVSYIGNNVFWKDDLDKVIPLKKGSPFDATLLKVGEGDILKEYANKGYLDAKVTSSLSEEDNSGIRIIYTIVQGEKTVVSKIELEGVTKFPVKRLISKLSSKIEGIFSDGTFKEENLTNDALAIERFYQDNGYLDARVRSSTFDISDNPAKKRKEVTLKYQIEEGSLYLYGGVAFEGNKIFSSAELQSLLKHPEGPFKKNKFEEDIARVQQLYADNGYVFNSYRDRSTISGDKVFYTLEITEAPQAHIGKITVEGNKKTKEKVILREIPLETGDYFSVEALRIGLMNLRNLRYFSNIVPDVQPELDHPGLVDLNLQVEEQGSADIQLGLTFTASADNPFPISFFTRWTERNFLGEGYTFGIGLNLSAFEQSIDVSFEDNWLIGIPWFWGVGFKTAHSVQSTYQDIDGPIFNGKEEVPDPYESWEEYVASEGRYANNPMNYGLWENALTGTTGYTFRTYLGRVTLSSALSIGLNYVYYDAKIQRPANYYLRENWHKFKFENTLRFAATWDTRDYYIAPQTGFRLSQSISFTGGFLFGQVHFTKLSTNFENYWRIFDWAPFGEDKWHWKFILKTKASYNVLLDPLGNNFEMETQPKHRLFMSESFGEGRGWGMKKNLYSTLSANITLSMPLWEAIIWWDVLFLDICTSSPNKDISVFNRALENYRFSWGTGLRSVLQQLPISICVVKPFWFDCEGKYREIDGSRGERFWKNWRLVVSLSVNT